jgi:hypothetical protein
MDGTRDDSDLTRRANDLYWGSDDGVNQTLQGRAVQQDWSAARRCRLPTLWGRNGVCQPYRAGAR